LDAFACYVFRSGSEAQNWRRGHSSQKICSSTGLCLQASASPFSTLVSSYSFAVNAC
jgi:hypothetical protein